MTTIGDVPTEFNNYTKSKYQDVIIELESKFGIKYFPAIEKLPWGGVLTLIA